MSRTTGLETPMKQPRFRLHRLTTALMLTGVLVACGGKDPEQLVASARDYLQKNDNAAAIIELKNALQEKNDFPEARLLLGKALLDSGDVVGAEAELRKAESRLAGLKDLRHKVARRLCERGILRADEITT